MTISGERKELPDDILSERCPIRYVITVQALREGWDCPFAYVLCSVAEMHSSTAVEQMLGRIMRLPHARAKRRPPLNVAYAFAASENFGATASALADSLVDNGFERREAQDYVMPFRPELMPLDLSNPTDPAEPTDVPAGDNRGEGQPPRTTEGGDWFGIPPTTGAGALHTGDSQHTATGLTQTTRGQVGTGGIGGTFPPMGPICRYFPAERGEEFAVPVLAFRQGQLIEPFEETHFSEIPWRLSRYDTALTTANLVGDEGGRLGEVTVNEEGRIHARFITTLRRQMVLLDSSQGW
ncbi:MAG TPA: hypothetical protein VN631_11730, partial [Negativicutes bacterium]|nr:hypothetical protein [Negativicutes bacterium]